jgi:hypothetical protein
VACKEVVGRSDEARPQLEAADRTWRGYFQDLPYAGWYIDPSSLPHLSPIQHEVSGQWTTDTTPDPGTGDNGFAGITAVPGGGLWAVGVPSNNGNYSTLIAYHP